MKRILFVIALIVSIAGIAHASQDACMYQNPTITFAPVHTSGLASTTFGSPTGGLTTPPDGWCPLQNGGDTSDGTAFTVEARCIGSTGSSFRSLMRTGFFRIASGNASVVALESVVRTSGSSDLDAATVTMVASGAYVLPRVTGVASAEIDWSCTVFSNAYRPAVP